MNASGTAQFKELLNQGKVADALHLRIVREIRSTKSEALSSAVQRCEAAYGGDWDALYDLEHGHEPDDKPSTGKLTVGGTYDPCLSLRLWSIRWYTPACVHDFPPVQLSTCGLVHTTI
eukprot:COSAG02_NODE_2522_length_8608_cov_47.463862_2_plen_118_part_00